MQAAQNIPYLSEQTLSGLGITTGNVIESIEALIRGAALGTVWSARRRLSCHPMAVT